MIIRTIAIVLAGLFVILPAHSVEARNLRIGGKLLLTSGVSTIEGSAGGGLATWAVIDGDETDAGIGASGHITYVALPDFDLKSYGFAVGIHDRIELSYANQSLDTRSAGAALGLRQGFVFRQDIFGAKLRVVGDALYDQDSVLPQISIGVQHKRAAQSVTLRAVGAESANGTDFYIAATKVILSKSLVLNATIRATKANHTGLLGFGSTAQRGYSAQWEASAGYLVTHQLLLGGEFRSKPDNLSFAREDHAYDIFAAYAVARHLTLTAAYVDLGSIATFKRQRGAFLSLRASL